MESKRLLLVSFGLNLLLVGSIAGFVLTHSSKPPAIVEEDGTAGATFRAASSADGGSIGIEPAISFEGADPKRPQTIAKPRSAISKNGESSRPFSAKPNTVFVPAINVTPTGWPSGSSLQPDSPARDGAAGGGAVASDDLALKPSARHGSGIPAAMVNLAAPISFQNSGQTSEPINRVDPTRPGNSISSGGQRVAVESFSVSPETGEGELNIAIEQAADTSPAVTARPPASATKTGGFTYEEELFRAKWGWVAFDRARKMTQEGEAK